jgi:uncharacterized protein with PIN domain
MFRFKHAILFSRMQSAQRQNLWILEDVFEKNKIVATKCTTCKEELGTWVQDSRILP